MTSQVDNSPLKVGYDATLKVFNDMKSDLRSNQIKTALKVSACIVSLFIFTELFLTTAVAALIYGSLGTIGGHIASGMVLGLACVLCTYVEGISQKEGFKNYHKIVCVFREKANKIDEKFNYSIGPTSINFRFFQPILDIAPYEKVVERYNDRTCWLERTLQRVFN